MSKKKLYGNTIYEIGKKEYVRITREFKEGIGYELKSKKNNEYKNIEKEKFYNAVKKYRNNIVDGNIKNNFTEFNAIFSIGYKNNELLKINLNCEDRYYKIIRLSEEVKKKSKEYFQKNIKNNKFSRRNLSKCINSVNLKENSCIKISVSKSKKICIKTYDEKYDNKCNLEGLYLTYEIFDKKYVDSYNKMIDKMYEINKSFSSFIKDLTSKLESREKRIFEDNLKQIIDENITKFDILKKWRELNVFVNDNNLIKDAKYLIKRESRAGFVYLITEESKEDKEKNKLKESIVNLIFTILNDLNIRTSHIITEEEKWIKINIDNDRHKSNFVTKKFIKEYLTSKDNKLFENIFEKFKLNDFINKHIQNKKNIMLGDTKLFKTFNEHYKSIFSEEFDSSDKKMEIEIEMIRFIYRYLKGRIEKVVSTGKVEHFYYVDKIKTKTLEALKNNVLEKIIYLGKIEHTKTNLFQKYHAFEELLNEFYVFYSFFNYKIMNFLNKKSDIKKEFYEYEYKDFVDEKCENEILNFKFKDLFSSEEKFKLFKNYVENIRNFSIHLNLVELKSKYKVKNIVHESYEELIKVVEKNKISDELISNHLNLDIIFKGQNNKYNEIIYKINKKIEKINYKKDVKYHLYPSLNGYIKKIKSELNIKEDSRENKEIVENALIYLIKNIYEIDIYNEDFIIEDIDFKFKKAQRKASESKNNNYIKSLQNYIYYEFIKYLNNNYEGIFNYEGGHNIREEIKNKFSEYKTNKDKSNKNKFNKKFILKTMSIPLTITNDLEYTIAIMGLLNDNRVVSRFINRCISTAEWIEGNDGKFSDYYESLIKNTNNLKTILKIKNNWNREELNKITKVMNSIYRKQISESDLVYLNENEKNFLIGHGLEYFRYINKGNEIVIDFDLEKYKINKDKSNIKKILDEVKNINKNKNSYTKYKNNVIKYSKFVLDNKCKIIEAQNKTKLYDVYIQKDNETIIYFDSIIKAYHNDSFEELNKILNNLNLGIIKTLEEHSDIDDDKVNSIENFLSKTRIKGKKPVIKEIILDDIKRQKYFEKNKELYKEYELYKFRRSIINHNIYNKLNDRLLDVQSKWLQWIARLERDLHYIIKGFDCIFTGLIVKTNPKISRPIMLNEEDGKFNYEKMHYTFPEKNDIKCYFEKLGFEPSFEILKKPKDKNIRNYIAHMHFIHKPFNCSILDVTNELSKLIRYRKLYNSAVERSIINIFKEEVDVDIIKNSKYINLEKIDKLLNPKLKTQLKLKDETDTMKIILELFKYKKS